MSRVDRSRMPLLIFVVLLCSACWFGSSIAGDAKAPDKQRINISAAKLNYYDKQQKLVYTGNVVAVRGDTTLKTPLLTIFLDPKQPGARPGPPSSSSQMSRMEASGPVTLISKGQIATGDFGIYEKKDSKIYIDGNVSLIEGPNVTKGDHIVYDLNTHQAVVTGHVRSLFVPNGDSGNAKNSGKEAGDQPQTKVR
ncbi:MAG: LptA/OstA family protein [Methylovirgula sp.]